MRRAQLLRQLVLESQYVIDEQMIAAAIVARALMRMTIADVAFRNDLLWG
jgi:hypothetical protein